MNDDYTDEADGVDDFDDDIHHPPVKQPTSRPRWEQPFSIPRAANEFTGELTDAPGTSAGRQRLTSRQGPISDATPVDAARQIEDHTYETPEPRLQQPATGYSQNAWGMPAHDPWTEPAGDDWAPVPAVPPAPPEPYTGRDLSSAAPANEPGRRKRTGRRIAVGALAVAAVAAVGVTGTHYLRNSDTTTEKPAAAAVPATSTSANPSTPADDCPDSTAGGIVRGDGPGDQQSGPGVIKAWNHAYYSERSGAAAKSVTTPGAVADANVIQQYIDKIPADTHYCLLIEPDAPTVANGPNRFRVTLTEIPPVEKGQDLQPVPTVIPQTIETIQVGGKTWITAIRKRDG